MKIYRIAKLSDALMEIGAIPEVALFIETAPNELKPLYMNAIKKNPSLSINELETLRPKEKVDPYLEEEKRFAMHLTHDEMKRWYLVNSRKLRQGRTNPLPDGTYGIEYGNLQQVMINNIGLIEDWYRNTPDGFDISKMSIQNIMQAQEEWHRTMAGKGEGNIYEPTKPELVVYGPNWKHNEYNGWTIQKVVGENDLDVEGNKMNHCVGSYCDYVDKGDTIIYSLRDPSNIPHVTIDTDPQSTEFRQIMGKSNSEPKDEYKAMIKEWVQHLGGIRYDVEGESPLEDFYDNYRDIEEMLESADEVLRDRKNEYGLTAHNPNEKIDLEDMIETLIQKSERESLNSRRGSYSGDITQADGVLFHLAQRKGLVEHNDPVEGLYELEKTLYDISEKYEGDYETNWHWKYWEDYPKASNFENDEEYEEAIREYEKGSQEAEDEAIREYRQENTRYALPDDMLKILHEMREKGEYPKWEELTALYDNKKAAKAFNWYKIAKIEETLKID